MLTLVVGGSASGKSAFAERLAVQSGLPRFYVATMRVWDAESEKRVARHRAMRREKRFETLECPLHLEKLGLTGLYRVAEAENRFSAREGAVMIWTLKECE